MAETLPGTKCPHLPAELWISVLSHVQDCNHLWSTCRRVSTDFRSYVETVFADKHIKKTRIEFAPQSFHHYQIPTVFDRFSDDRKRAYFKDNRPLQYFAEKGMDTQYMLAIRVHWRSSMIWYLGSRDACGGKREQPPPYTIKVRRSINDTDIPGLEINYEAREISFEWTTMYDLFFCEEEYVRRKKDEALKAVQPIDKSTGSNNQGSIPGIDADLLKLMEKDRIEHRAWKEARRARLKSWYKKHHNFDSQCACWSFDDDDDHRLRSMKRPRDDLAGLGFSDDET